TDCGGIGCDCGVWGRNLSIIVHEIGHGIISIGWRRKRFDTFGDFWLMGSDLT
ncbi:hypothetical protein LCGC14_1211490, partial [marine sediment metagenome]